MNPPALVFTTIHSPSDAMRQFASECGKFGVRMIVVGDKATPAEFHLPHSEYYDLNSQYDLGFRLASSCPVDSYARKNLGYLIALSGGGPIILESDDDNLPLPGFFETRKRYVNTAHVTEAGWANVYSYFTDAKVWPRGFPLDAIRTPPPPYGDLPAKELDCPIQQGLVEGDADVDAIFRLVCGDPPPFQQGIRIALGRGSWCPINSQNTAWWVDAAPLMYLPAYCSFRMTDIWRGVIAQRIAWENGWSVLFHGANVRQNRNRHDLMDDFEQEIQGYLRVRRVSEVLMSAPLSPGISSIPENLRSCYRALVEHEIVREAELQLLDDWLTDVAMLT